MINLPEQYRNEILSCIGFPLLPIELLGELATVTINEQGEAITDNKAGGYRKEKRYVHR